MNFGIALRIVPIILMAGVACRSATDDPPSGPPANADDVIVRWNGGALTAEAIQEQMGNLSPTGRAALTDLGRKRDLVDRMVTNRLLFEEGTRRGYGSDPDIVRQLDALRESLVVQRLMREVRRPPAVSEAEARAYYDENRLLYSTTQVRASHILLNDEDTAAAVAAEAAAHPDRFAELARAKSTDESSAKRGGDLGSFGPGRMPADFERAAFALREGEVSPPVQTRYGWHVILVTERHEGDVRPFEAVERQITSLLANRKLEARVEETVATLRQAAKIEIDDTRLEALEPPPGGGPPPHAGMAGH